MNCVSSFYNSPDCRSEKTAIVFYENIQSLKNNKSSINFSNLHNNTLRAQNYLISNGFKKGDTLLLMEMSGPDSFAFIIASLACGMKILLIEPWLSLDKITKIIERTQPKGFMTKTFGRLWGLRSRSVRNIPFWFQSSILHKYQPIKNHIIAEMNEDDNAILTFTSGTTGQPKAVHRKHGYLLTQMNVLQKHLHYNQFKGPDLTIFTNIVLLNLVNGKPSILIPPKWPVQSLKHLDLLPQSLSPETMAVGPAFLNKLIQNCELKNLKSLHVGGALCDNNVYEKAISKWRGQELIHVYGSSEAEPVALSQLEEAVQKSKDQNYFQTLYLGNTIEEITMDTGSSSAWISGIHVSPLYEGDSEESKKNKKIDSQGVLWHNMGDRLKSSENGLWYKGRDFQKLEDFELEQNIYQFNKSSLSFIHRSDDKCYLLGENLNSQKIINHFPTINKVIKTKIIRDVRHRARIDRNKSIKGKL